MANPTSIQLETQSTRASIKQSLVATSLTQLINFLVRILLPPLYLHAWGVGGYADWLVLASFAFYLSLSNLGGQRFLCNHLTQRYSKGEISVFKIDLNSGLALITTTAIIMLILSGIILYFLPLSHLFKPHYFTIATCKWLLWLLALQILSALVQGALTDVFRSTGHQAYSIMLHNAMSFMQVTLCAISLWLKLPPLIVVTSQIIPVLLLIAFAKSSLSKRFKYDLFHRRYVNYAKAKSFIRPSLDFFGIELSYALSIQGMIVALGIAVGSLQLILFSTTRTIINTMKQILTVFFNASWRELTHFDATDHPKQFQLLFRAILRSSLCTAALIATGLYLFAKPLYTFWLGEKVPFNSQLMNLFLAYGLQSVFWTACANLLMTINKTRYLASIYLLTAISSIPTVALLAHFYTLETAIIGMTIIELALPCWLVPYLCYRYNKQFNGIFFVKEIMPILIGCITIRWESSTIVMVLPLLIFWWYKSLPKKALQHAD